MHGASIGKDTVVRIHPLYSDSPPCLLALDGVLVLGRAAEYLHHATEFRRTASSGSEVGKPPEAEGSQWPQFHELLHHDAYVLGVMLKARPQAHGESIRSQKPRRKMPTAVRESLGFPHDYWAGTQVFSDDLVEAYEVTDPASCLIPVEFVYDIDYTIACPPVWHALSSGKQERSSGSVMRRSNRAKTKPTRSKRSRRGQLDRSPSAAPTSDNSDPKSLQSSNGSSKSSRNVSEESYNSPSGVGNSQSHDPLSLTSSHSSFARVEKRMLLMCQRLRLPWRSASTLLHSIGYFTSDLSVSDQRDREQAGKYGILIGTMPSSFLRDAKRGGLLKLSYEL